MKKLDSLVNDLYNNFTIIKGTPTFEDIMHFTVPVGSVWMELTVDNKKKRIEVSGNPNYNHEQERKLLKRHLRECIEGWRIC